MIFQPISPTAYWALVTCPDRRRPTLHGWWAPVALRYIKWWGPAARGTRFTVSRKPHRQTLDRSKRARSQRRKAPLTSPLPLHCITVSTASPLLTDRRCPCAASVNEPEMAGSSSSATLSEGSGSTPTPLSLSLLSFPSVHPVFKGTNPRSTARDHKCT